MASKKEANLEDFIPYPASEANVASIEAAEKAMAFVDVKGQKRKKGITTDTVPKKSKLTRRGQQQQNWRPLAYMKNSQPERKCSLNGLEITLRQCRSFVMFQIQELTQVIYNSVPMKLSYEDLVGLTASYVKVRRPQLNSEAKAWRHEFLSWKSFKHFLEHTLHDQCLRYILRTYVPNNDFEAKFGGSLGNKEAPATFLGSESDYVKIAGVTIPFMVKCGKIYFDLFPAFTILGKVPKFRYL